MFDVKRLPQRALCDTGFWMRALGDRPEDARSADALEFFEEMTKYGRELLIATPTLAELLRGNPGIAIPSTPSVVVVGFDRLAADVLGRRFNASVLKQQKLKTGHQKGYIQFDAMIVACAIRHKADCIVSFDNTVGADIDNLEIPVHNVKHFRLPLLADYTSKAKVEADKVTWHLNEAAGGWATLILNTPPANTNAEDPPEDPGDKSGPPGSKNP